MSEKNKKDSNKNNIKVPKFNFYWIYGIIFVLFLGYQFLNSGSLSSKNLSTNEFRSILADNDIDKIVIVNKDIANIFVKNEALTKEKHQKNKSSLYSSNMPLYYYDFGDLQNFEKELDSEKVSKELDFDVAHDNKTNFFETLHLRTII